MAQKRHVICASFVVILSALGYAVVSTVYRQQQFNGSGTGHLESLWQPAVRSNHLRLLQCADAKISCQRQLNEGRRRTRAVFSHKKIAFLQNYRNPCWMEQQLSPNLYLDDNAYFAQLLPRVGEHGREQITSIQTDWQKKYAKGERKRVRCLPYYYLAGVTKSGTTALWRDLHIHPEIMSGIIWKEAQWWNRRALGQWTYNMSHFTMSDYIGLYDRVAATIEQDRTESDFHPIITGDGSPSTLWNADIWPLYPGNENVSEPKTLVPDLIYSVTPQAKIIVIVRDPVDRLYSHYFHNMRRYGLQGSKHDFHEKVSAATQRLKECMQQRSTRECLYDTCINGDAHYAKVPLRAGIYDVYLEDWLRVFPQKQLKVVRFEDFIRDKLAVLHQIWAFLDLGTLPEEIAISFNNRSRTTHHRRSMTSVGDMFEVTRNILIDFYQPFNQNLARRLRNKEYLWTS